MLLIFQCVLFYRYEGEWLQNDMEGHGVAEVDIPDIEPAPGSKYVIYLASICVS